MTAPPLTFETHAVEETIDLGRRLGRALVPQAVVALVGALGSGKTHFVKGIARGNDAPDGVVVSSPTFVLVNEYPGRIPLFHIDVFRLGGSLELEALGFQEMIAGDSATCIEWADRVLDALPADHLRIDIDIAGPTDRRITLSAGGERSATLLRSFG